MVEDTHCFTNSAINNMAKNDKAINTMTNITRTSDRVKRSLYKLNQRLKEIGRRCKWLI